MRVLFHEEGRGMISVLANNTLARGNMRHDQTDLT